MDKQAPQLNMDTNSRRNFIRFFKSLGEKPSTTVRFFDHSDCYTVHGKDDANLIARMVYKSTAYITEMIPDDATSIPHVTLYKNKFESAVRELLLVRNYRVEVYVRSATGNANWNLEYRGSPGNLLQFEDIIFTNKEELVGNSILSLQMRMNNNARNIGVVAVEQNDCLFQVLEFVDDDFLTELEATVVLLGPKECLLPSQEGEYEAVKNLLERNGIMVTVASKSQMASEKNDLIQDLNKLLRFNKGQQEDATGLPELTFTIAMEALKLAIKYLALMSDSSNLGHYTLQQLNLKRFVHMDAAAVSALNILPKPGTHPSSPAYRWQSVLGVLDRCNTPQGHRLMAQWVKQPLRSREILNDRHDIVQCFIESPNSLNSLYEDFLKRIPDILMLTKKLLRKKANLQDIFRIYQVLLRTPKIINLLKSLENSTVKNVICEPMQNFLEDLSGLKQMVEQVMDFDAIENGEYLVKASFDSDLLDMKERMDHLLEKMERCQDKANRDLDLDKNSVKLVNVPNVGYTLRITLKDDTVLRKNKEYKIIDVLRGGIRFTTDKLSSINDEFVTLRSQYEEQQKTIVEEIIKVAVGYASPLTSLNNEFAQLDCLVSFAIAAQSAPIPYIRPQILEEGSGELVLKDIRHPCLELQEHISFIANSVEFKKDVCNMFIITGPNMGGKSTYIRSVGTAVLMAHVGSFVPCSEATISMVDSILGRVGASDNIIKGLSTFMVEMIETSGIIRSATEKSLVIIDELGRGTSTYEGCGIAWSIAEHLAKETKCFTLFATHFHEITNLSETVPTVKNCHMAAVADNDNFTLLYQVRPGVMEKSFGIQVARLANFPEKVVHHAQQVYNEFEDEHADKQSCDDKVLLEKINKAIENLSTTGNNVDINESDLSKLVEQFTQDIRKLDSEYFKCVLATAGATE
ncbi:DNA mismatch repair protein spellchecker 1 [Musca domestica]|uniref:DNA mismatch repair protein spellchecker 1 n=1 Tax=Musca domestica TaxID=7370 RepID=A0A1I8N9I9_MUSDO|nr:DNA mismatch repair protein spellchecker 1 [Musca domestica]